jgi:hypothetical protein
MDPIKVYLFGIMLFFALSSLALLVELSRLGSEIKNVLYQLDMVCIKLRAIQNNLYDYDSERNGIH